MPVFVDDGITITLKSGDTVTLYERNISVSERQSIRKRTLLVSAQLGYKQKQAEKIDDRRKAIETDETLNGDRAAKLDEVDEAAAELLSSMDLIEWYAEGLSRRFESWDVYVTRQDKEANNPLALTKEAIMAFCEKPRRAALITEIIEKLAEYDKGEEKKDGPMPGSTGVGSTMTQNSRSE
jgi:hypothetical protein